MTAQRRYAMTKGHRDGEWYLHGNDIDTSTGFARGGTLFRIERWVDGPHLGAERVRVRWTLSAAPWEDAHRALLAPFGSPLDAVSWEHVAEHDTRRDAINEAVAISEARRLARQEGTP